MVISLIGYMGSGKSHVSKILSKHINFKLIDLDHAISERHQLSIPEIFEKKGEIYFRKQEKEILEELLEKEKSAIISLGGGTPVYYNNITTINENSVSIFLRASVKTLSERLIKEKNERPLISRIPEEELPEFIAKHLFERNPFYNQAQIIIDTDSKDAEEIADEIISKISLV